MKKNNTIVIYDLQSTYHELQEYSFKVILNPKFFKNGHSVTIDMFDPDSKKMDIDVRHWGKKISCMFNITKDVPDGVCVVKFKARTDKGRRISETFHYWVIK